MLNDIDMEIVCPMCNRKGKYIIEDNWIICKCGHDLMEFKENA